jgi:hypothetical protein
MYEGWLGMDQYLTEESHRGMVNTSENLTQSTTGVAALVGMLEEGGLWEGPEAEEFFRDFKAFLPKLRSASHAVDIHAGELRWRLGIQQNVSGK